MRKQHCMYVGKLEYSSSDKVSLSSPVNWSVGEVQPQNKHHHHHTKFTVNASRSSLCNGRKGEEERE